MPRLHGCVAPLLLLALSLRVVACLPMGEHTMGRLLAQTCHAAVRVVVSGSRLMHRWCHNWRAGSAQLRMLLQQSTDDAAVDAQATATPGLSASLKPGYHVVPRYGWL